MEKAENLDLKSFRIINDRVPYWKPINPFMKFVARFGPLLFLIPLGISYLVAKRYQSSEHRRNLSQAIVGIFYVYSFNTPLRRIIQRPRPYFTRPDVHRLDPVHHQPSLPSDHATVSFNIARSFRREPLILRAPTYLLAAIISFGRVYSGEHYPSDVLVGALIGLGIESLVERNWPRIRRKIEEGEKVLSRQT